MNKVFNHAKNEVCMLQLKKIWLPNKFILFIGKKKYIIQFFVYFHMMAKGRPMIE